MAHDNVAVPATYQEALDALSRVADGNGNKCKLKLVRRPNAASTVTQHIATFGDATWSHIADAERHAIGLLARPRPALELGRQRSRGDCTFTFHYGWRALERRNRTANPRRCNRALQPLSVAAGRD